MSFCREPCFDFPAFHASVLMNTVRKILFMNLRRMKSYGFVSNLQNDLVIGCYGDYFAFTFCLKNELLCILTGFDVNFLICVVILL